MSRESGRLEVRVVQLLPFKKRLAGNPLVLLLPRLLAVVTSRLEEKQAKFEKQRYKNVSPEKDQRRLHKKKLFEIVFFFFTFEEKAFVLDLAHFCVSELIKIKETMGGDSSVQKWPPLNGKVGWLIHGYWVNRCNILWARSDHLKRPRQEANSSNCRHPVKKDHACDFTMGFFHWKQLVCQKDEKENTAKKQEEVQPNNRNGTPAVT